MPVSWVMCGGHDHLWVHELAERVGYSPVLDFDCADFDEFGAFVWVEAGGFGVEHDVVKQWRFQWRYASRVVASVLIPVAHGVPFLRFIFLCGHSQCSIFTGQAGTTSRFGKVNNKLA